MAFTRILRRHEDRGGYCSSGQLFVPQLAVYFNYFSFSTRVEFVLDFIVHVKKNLKRLLFLLCSFKFFPVNILFFLF